MTDDVLTFWNNRAGLGQWAGTKDLIAKQIEIEAICSYIHNGMNVLDVGCGNGITAIEIAKRYDVAVTGIDFAEEMVANAISLLEGQELKGSVKFQAGDVLNLPSLPIKFDLIYTERTLVNLPDWSAQKQAIANIAKLLIDEGFYVMCENSQDGLDKINHFRSKINLPKIIQPWHNHYLHDIDIKITRIEGLILQDINYYSSTYYFLSRVVNAWLMEQEGKEPDYNSPINRLALSLPPLGEFGQGRIWLWKRDYRRTTVYC